MLKKNISSLLVALMFCAVSYAPAFAQGDSDRPTYTKHYVAQNDQSASEEDQSSSEEGGQEQESDQQAEPTAATGEPAADLSSFLPGGGGGGRVSLATLFVQGIGMGILIVFLVAIPISFTCVMCALIWKIGMVARGGKKPDIG
jgi:hypothetical protein